MKLQRALPFRLFLSFLLVALVSSLASAQCLDVCYHTRAKVDSFIADLVAYDAAHFHIAHVDTIGWSRGDQLGVRYPLYAIKISDHPDQFEDEPTALIVGHIHAEEVIGLETMINYVWRLDSLYGLYRTLINNTQLYFVPTINPDGLEVISRNWDCTYRKNGYVPPQLDTCIVVNGMGQDSCGVDLNRQSNLNWIYGDSLWYPTALERFDYFRGAGPFSEPEAQALRDLSVQIKPTISAVFHSSRAGGNAERSIAAWNWEETTDGPAKSSPDCTAIGFLNNLYCDASNFGIRYHAAFHSKRNGELQDWFYRELGTIQFNTELGPPVNIQPHCDTLAVLVNQDRVALNWLLERLLNLGHLTQPPVTIHTFSGPDNSTPISAEWRYLNTWKAILNPWYTNEQFGSATTLLATPGTASFMARKEGFLPDTQTVTVYPNDPQSVNLHLTPLPWHTLNLALYDAASNRISGRVYLDAEFPHWVSVPAEGTSISLPEGSFRATAIGDGIDHMVLFRTFYLGGDETQEFHLPGSSTRMAESFESGLNGWTAGGAGNPWRTENDTTGLGFGASLCNAPTGYRAQYANNLNATLTYALPIALSSDTNNVAALTFWRRGRLDMPADSFFAEVLSDADTTWHTVAGYSDLEIPWTQSWANLTPYMGHTIQFRFRFKTDGVLGDLGLHIDDVQITTGMDAAAPVRPSVISYSYRITGSYPNPFNPSTTVSYEVAAPGLVKLVLFNTLGQEVRRYEVNAPAAGPQRLTWDGLSAAGSPVGSGLYFVQLQACGSISTHKLLLLR
ncbi:MAG TPA: M14 family zinc carboxypeptidase [bacterium]|jgi:hypothetical protein